MRLKNAYEILDGIAPFSLSREYCEKYGAYDNSGVIVDVGREIERITFSLDCSAASVGKAKEFGAQLLVTHHPAIYSPVHRLIVGGEGSNVLKAAAEGISVISTHLCLDCASGGIDESLMEGIGGKDPLIMHSLSQGGYGRVYDLEGDLKDLAEHIGKTFSTHRITVYGEGQVHRVMSACGAGFDEQTLAFALDRGADCLVTSDGKHHLVAEGVERGLKIILLTHYASETYGFRRFYEKAKEKLGVPCEFFVDQRLL